MKLKLLNGKDRFTLLKTERHSEALAEESIKILDCHGDFQSPRNDKSCHSEEETKCFVEEELYSESHEMLNVVISRKNTQPLLQHDKFELLKKKAAFTLAEVLITLSILGVVAAISIPNMVQQYQKRITITKLQKAYATLEQAANNIAVNTGCFGQTINCSGLLNYSDEELTKKFFELSNLNISKIYKTNKYIYYKAMNYDRLSSSSDGKRNFLYAYIDKNNIGYKIDKATIYLNPNSITSDTTSGLLITVFTNPSFDKYHTENSKKWFNDIKEGYNVFQFLIYDNFIVEPNAGCSGGRKQPLSKVPNYNTSSCSKTNTTNCYGNSCAARIIKEGWKINY